MLIALLIGAITGWLLSMPIGPVNAAAISRTLKDGFRYGLAVGIGGALMDVIYCGGSAQINQFLVASPIVNLLFEVAGFVALIWLGVRQLSPKPTPEEETNAHEHEIGDSKLGDGSIGGRAAAVAMRRMHIEKKGLAGPFILGVFLYATNVMAVPEWIIISGLWRSWGLLGAGLQVNLIFALGAGVGTASWFIVLVRLIAKSHSGFKPSTLKKINFGTSIAMFVFGAYFGYAILFETNWKSVGIHFKQDTNQVLDSVQSK